MKILVDYLNSSRMKWIEEEPPRTLVSKAKIKWRRGGIEPPDIGDLIPPMKIYILVTSISKKKKIFKAHWIFRQCQVTISTSFPLICSSLCPMFLLLLLLFLLWFVNLSVVLLHEFEWRIKGDENFDIWLRECDSGVLRLRTWVGVNVVIVRLRKKWERLNFNLWAKKWFRPKWEREFWLYRWWWSSWFSYEVC